MRLSSFVGLALGIWVVLFGACSRPPTPAEVNLGVCLARALEAGNEPEKAIRICTPVVAPVPDAGAKVL